ncbi:MAG: FAD-dependent oxidoreductase, partial [Clostridia bacterium]|nr:FAD-dependent oxidoreductase [Clostridia bacterium]
MEKVDVAIIGGGIGGLMVAYGLLEKDSSLKIVIFDKGHPLEKRSCPIIEHKTDRCIGCRPCSIMNGFAGAGAFSDGKFIISNEFGGNLPNILGDMQTLEYIKKADDILVKFGASKKTFEPDKELIDLCRKNGLRIKKGIAKHFGTENNLKIMGAMINSLKERCTMYADCTVTDVEPKSKTIYTDCMEPITAKTVIFAVGRSGSGFFTKWCGSHGVMLHNNKVDIGVRVELKAEVWKKISEVAYDPKISYISEKYGDETRMFCFNDGGHVVMENTFDTKTVNGHAYGSKEYKSDNCNFALLTSIKFSQPFNNPIEYVHLFASCANYISGGTVVVQRFGDLAKGRRTTAERLETCSVRPTLKAYPGDLSLCMPKRQLDSIIETIY